MLIGPLLTRRYLSLHPNRPKFIHEMLMSVGISIINLILAIHNVFNLDKTHLRR
jgi:hypothetical protein